MWGDKAHLMTNWLAALTMMIWMILRSRQLWPTFHWEREERWSVFFFLFFWFQVSDYNSLLVVCASHLKQYTFG